jgi:8-oxo-dGTP pyrophosphatase MutT (NUDIX family)
MEHYLHDIPVIAFTSLSKDTPLNPDFWRITGIDTKSPSPQSAEYSHGIVTIDDPKLGLCMVVNMDGGSDKGSYYNIIGGAAETGESPRDTFIREMEEETGIKPNSDTLSYIGLVQTDHLPPTPLFRYHIQNEDIANKHTISGSTKIAFIPCSVLEKQIPETLYKVLFAAGS